MGKSIEHHIFNTIHGILSWKLIIIFIPIFSIKNRFQQIKSIQYPFTLINIEKITNFIPKTQLFICTFFFWKKNLQYIGGMLFKPEFNIISKLYSIFHHYFKSFLLTRKFLFFFFFSFQFKMGFENTVFYYFYYYSVSALYLYTETKFFWISKMKRNFLMKNASQVVQIIIINIYKRLIITNVSNILFRIIVINLLNKICSID